MTDEQPIVAKRPRGRPPGPARPKMNRFYIRDIDPEIWRRFKRLAARHHYRLNQLALAIIQQAVDFGDAEWDREQAAATEEARRKPEAPDPRKVA